MDRFWKWRIRDQADDEGASERELFLNGAIASESWFEDDVTPAVFKDELTSGDGNITVWLNSPGGDVFASAQIYNMLRAYKGKVTVKIDSLAASAASVIAMAGDEVQISPAGMLMIHNPSTVAMGDHTELEKAIDMLAEVKNSIITAYQQRTGLSRNKLSKLMEDETWMDATKAIELGFADEMIERNSEIETKAYMPAKGCLFSSRPFEASVTNQVIDYVKRNEPAEEPEEEKPTDGPVVSADELYNRLKEIKENW